MECVAILLVIVATLVVLAVRGLTGWQGAGSSGAFQQLARRFHGVFVRGGWFTRARVYFRYGPSHVQVGHTKLADGECVAEVVMDWPDAQLRCELRSLARGEENPFRNTTAFSSGSAEFDRHYIITGDAPAEVRRFLTDGVQWTVEQLRQFAGTPVEIRIRGGRIVVRKRATPRRIRQFDQWERFTQLCLELHDQAMLTRSIGIEFVEGCEAEPIREITCRICGDEIVTDMVICRRCKTPHHRECWVYNGACSTYGCQETRHVAPVVAAPVVRTSVMDGVQQANPSSSS